jgi:ketosteroid isomerase-like protein
MDTHENKKLVMAGYRLFQSGDIRTLLDSYHDDAESIGPESEFVPFAGSFHGKAEIAQFFAKLHAAVQAIRFEPKEFIADGDKVIVIGESSWLVRQTGRSYDSSWVHVFTVREGKIARFEAYYDTAATEKAFLPDQSGRAADAARLHH